MALKFKKQQYMDKDGKTPSDYICELLDKGVNVIKLATYIQKIPNGGVLVGNPLYKLKRPAIGIWVRYQDKYGLIYSYFKSRNEVCFLQLVESKSKDHVTTAINRVKEFYGIWYKKGKCYEKKLCPKSKF